MTQLSPQSNLAPTPTFWQGMRDRLRQGGLGPLPVMIGLVIIALIFQALNENFLTPVNLTNLLFQIAAIGTISIGVVMVLLLGEVDLSVGSVSGLCAAIMAVLVVKQGWPAWSGILAGVLVGGLIGAFQGFWVSYFKVPSFVVSLAGLLGWQGALLAVLGDTGTINLSDKLITGLANTLLPAWAGWLVGIVGVLVYGFLVYNEYRKRQAANLPVGNVSIMVWRVALVAIGVLGIIAFMNTNRNPRIEPPILGIPMAVVIFISLLVIFDFITQRMRFGRYIYAVGGNTEAARRAGINVNAIRISVFTLSSMLAAFGGILASSRLYAVNQSSGAGDVLLNAIAAAVIGGTSLFGGRGRIWSALLGALVIGSIANGMDLLALSSSIKFMVTGAVLLTAVTLDAVTRSKRESTGR